MVYSYIYREPFTSSSWQDYQEKKMYINKYPWTFYSKHRLKYANLIMIYNTFIQRNRTKANRLEKSKVERKGKMSFPYLSSFIVTNSRCSSMLVCFTRKFSPRDIILSILVFRLKFMLLRTARERNWEMMCTDQLSGKDWRTCKSYISS